LKVGAIVEGSVVQSNGRIRVNVRLVRLPSEESLWTRTYERDGSDILVLQGEMARNIGEQIGALITPEERQRMVSRARKVDPDLHALYLNGRFLALEPNRNMIDRVRNPGEVVERDPTHAPAYAALAEAWFQLASAYMAPSEAMPKAKTAARRAIGLDPESDEARATLGRIHLFYDWDWQASEEQLQKALDLNPNSSAAYRGLGCLRMALGRTDESLKAAEQGLRLSPMHLWTRFDSAMLLALAGRMTKRSVRPGAHRSGNPRSGYNGRSSAWLTRRKGSWPWRFASWKPPSRHKESPPLSVFSRLFTHYQAENQKRSVLLLN
jgi:hypothetical protein